jgi:hypothetical protein
MGACVGRAALAAVQAGFSLALFMGTENQSTRMALSPELLSVGQS